LLAIIEAPLALEIAGPQLDFPAGTLFDRTWNKA
jgi:hypothetical protein